MDLLFLLILAIFVLFSYSAAEEGWFLHVTDFHYDFTYGSKDLSCNGVVQNHGIYGDYWCDSSLTLINATIQAMNKTAENLTTDFILWTGDSILHTGNENLDLNKSDEIIAKLTNMIQKYFPALPVYATYGNHDYYPNGQFPPNNNELYNRTLEHWRQWIKDSEQKETFRRGAYYTVKTQYGMRILALNTNMYYTSDKVTAHLQDPSGQFAWMERVLNASKFSEEKVLVIGHVPPGVAAEGGKPWMYKHFNKRLVHILQRYSDIIVGLHFGHEHADTFRMFYNSFGDPVMTLFIAPSVTPWRYKIPAGTGPAHNPSFRFIKYDRSSGDHLDLIQYYMDLPESNKQGTSIWRIEYTATSDMRVPDIKPRSMNDLVGRMSDPNSKEFQNHYRWRNVNTEGQFFIPCDTKCHSFLFCNFIKLYQNDYNDCMREKEHHAPNSGVLGK